MELYPDVLLDSFIIYSSFLKKNPFNHVIWKYSCTSFLIYMPLFCFPDLLRCPGLFVWCWMSMTSMDSLFLFLIRGENIQVCALKYNVTCMFCVHYQFEGISFLVLLSRVFIMQVHWKCQMHFLHLLLWCYGFHLYSVNKVNYIEWFSNFKPSWRS